MASSVTLSSSTIEGQMVELVSRIQIAEADSAKNPNNVNAITGSYNQDTGIFSGTFSIPCDAAVDASGLPSFAAQEYLND